MISPEKEEAVNSLLQEAKLLIHKEIDDAYEKTWVAFSESIVESWTPGIAESYHYFGLIFLNRGDYTAAMKYFLKSIVSKRTMGDKRGICASCINIGIIYLHLRNLESARNYFQEAYVAAQDIKSEELEMKAVVNLGICEMQAENYDEALPIFLHTLEICKKLKMEKEMALVLDNAGIVYGKIGKPEEALKCHTDALRIKKKFDDKPNIARGYGNIANFHYEKGHYAKAITFYSKGLEVCKAYGAMDISAELYEKISNAYALMKKFKYAYLYRLKYEKNRAQVISEESIKILSTFEFLHRSEEKEREIEKLKEDILEKEELLNNVIQSKQRLPLPEHLKSLSRREIEIVSFVACGLTDKELAEKLTISTNTVKTHLKRIFSKLLIKNRTELVGMATKIGIIADPLKTQSPV